MAEEITKRIRQRAELYQRIRSYFQQQEVLEVEVPVLGRTTALDPHLASMSLQTQAETLYLQPSPEFFMKRLLALGSGSIFSIGKAFRAGELGRRHNPEFSMLEWYRNDFNLAELMADVENLIKQLIPNLTFEHRRYADLYQAVLGFNPHSCSMQKITEAIAAHTSFKGALDRPSSLDLLMSAVIEPSLSGNDALFITDFPVSQAAMAAIGQDNDGHQVAQRFELYMRGVEIANGYAELTDADEQRRRFEADTETRKQRQLASIPMDKKLLAAMHKGLPACSGVALGLDRLLWILHADGQNTDIAATLLFPWGEL